MIETTRTQEAKGACASHPGDSYKAWSSGTAWGLAAADRMGRKAIP